MAVRYFDSVNGNDANDGLSPGTAWASLDNKAGSWSGGDSLLFARGTTQVINTAYRQFPNGSSSVPTYIGAYGTGARPRITNPTSAGGMIMNSSNASYVTYEDIDFDCTVTSGSGVQSLYISAQGGGAAHDLIFRRCLFRNSSNSSGLNITQEAAATGAPNNLLFEDCASFNNYAHGFVTTGYNVTFNRCYAWNNGLGTGAHGFSSYRVRETISTGGWTNVSGNIYSRSITRSNYYYGRLLTGAQYGTIIALVKNTSTPTTPNLGEFGVSGATLYVNIGADPGTHTFSFAYGVGGNNITYNDCVAYNNKHFVGYSSHEGHGFAFDDFSSFCTMNRCVSIGNDGYGLSINQGEGNSITRSVLANNKYYAIGATGLPNHYVYNNLMYANGTGLTPPFPEVSFSDLATGYQIKNNVIHSKYSTYGIQTLTSGTGTGTVSNNVIYNDNSTMNTYFGAGDTSTSYRNLLPNSYLSGTNGNGNMPTGWTKVGTYFTTTTLAGPTAINGLSVQYAQLRRIAGTGYEGIGVNGDFMTVGIQYGISFWVRIPTGLTPADITIFTGTAVPAAFNILFTASLAALPKDTWVRLGGNITITAGPTTIIGIVANAAAIGTGFDLALPQFWAGTCFLDTFGVPNINGKSVNPQVNSDFTILGKNSPLKGAGTFVNLVSDKNGKAYLNPPSVGPWELGSK